MRAAWSAVGGWASSGLWGKGGCGRRVGGRSGSGGGTPLVNGSSQTGSSLITDGWPASKTVLRAGDYFSVNGELKQVTSDVLSDGSGNATIPFKPFLRGSPADNAPLTITRASCEMALVDDQQAIWETNERGVYMPKTFSAVEVFS